VGIDEGERENKFWYNEGDVKARIRDGVAAHTLANTNQLFFYFFELLENFILIKIKIIFA